MFWDLFSTKAKTAIKPLVISPESIYEQEIESFSDTGRGDVTWKTLVSSPLTNTDSLTAGIATCPPKSGHLCSHRHKQAEIYYITEGRGIVEIDGVKSAVQAGSVVYIPGNAKHGIKNDDPDRELKWLYVFPSDGFKDVKYRFDDS